MNVWLKRDKFAILGTGSVGKRGRKAETIGTVVNCFFVRWVFIEKKADDDDWLKAAASCLKGKVELNWKEEEERMGSSSVSINNQWGTFDRTAVVSKWRFEGYVRFLRSSNKHW